MPRAANSTTLRRNQACKQCRKRKLKCDAQRPHCGTCQKQWAAQIAVPPPVGFAHPTEPSCTYDPVEGLVLAPDTVEDPNERVRLLEAQINQLQSKLVAAQAESGRASSADPADQYQHQHQHQHHQHQHQHQHQQQYHQSIASSSRPYQSTSPPSANALPPSLNSGSSSGSSGLSPNGLSSNSLYTHPPQDPLHLGYAPGRNVPGPTLPPLNAFKEGSGGGGYVDNNNNNNNPGGGGGGGGGYYATGLHSDVRSTSYPNVSDEVLPSDRTHGRTSSHPYHRGQPHVSAIAKAERAQYHHASTSGHVRSGSDMDDPFTGVNDMNILSVSKLGRQTDHRSRGYSMTSHPSPPFYDIMFSGWSRDLPPRHELVNYIEIFFRCDPCSSRMLHRPTLLNNLNYPPTHPDFPHPALLHAICATASRYTFRGRLDASLNASLSSQQQQVQPPPRDKFAEFHANKTRAYVNATMSNGQNIFDVWQACIILSWWFYSEGRWVEVWIQAGFQTRAVIPLGLNYLGLIKRGPDGQAVKNPYLAPPKSNLETETRRRAWWMSILFDRIVSVGGWLHSVDERDIGTELPLPYAHYEAMIDMPSNPQTLHSESVYTRHPVAYTDSYLLFLKSVMLFGRITDYAVRMGIRAPLLAQGHGFGAQAHNHEGQSPLNPHHLSPNATTTSFNLGSTTTNPNTPTAGVGSTGIPSPSGGATTPGMTDPRSAPGFQALDRLVASDFLNSFPPPFRSCLGAGGGGTGLDGVGVEQGFGMYPGGIDTDLYVAHLVPHAATITLHSPWVNYADPSKCPSVARCMEAARAILDKYYLLTSTSFDITLLHPFVTIAWYLAAVVQIHLCKRLIETGDLVGEATCWGEINMLRNALVIYGNVSPIGTRQEKLLHPIMKEIIDMTTQSQPLFVGLPLYPFSLDSAFQRAEKQAAAAAAAASGSGVLTHSGNMSRIDALLNAPSAEEVDVDDAVAPIPDISYGEDGDTVMGGIESHSHQANQQHVASIAVPSVQSLGTGWTMMTDGK